MRGQISGGKFKDPVPDAPADDVKKSAQTSTLAKGSGEVGIKYQAVDKQEEKELGKLYFILFQ